jgi:hypothetical protein
MGNNKTLAEDKTTLNVNTIGFYNVYSDTEFPVEL